MKRKAVSGIMLTLLLLSMLTLALNVQPVKASGTIYIRADGSIDPSTAPIYRNGSTYTLTDDIYGFIVVEKDNVTIYGNGYKLEGEMDSFGLHLSERKNITIREMHIRNFEYGIYLKYSEHNALIDNRLENNTNGIFLDFSNHNSLIGNNLTSNIHGISLRYSCNNTLIRNLMTSNRYNFGPVGIRELQFYENYVDTSNKVDEKPIYYWINRHNETVPLDAGCVIIVNCTDIRVANLEVRNNLAGVTFAYSSRCTIENVTVTANGYGIVLDNSYQNILTNNNATSNDEGGISLIASFHNLLINNVAMKNTGMGVVGGAGGIYLEDTSNNFIIGNILANNTLGIGVDDSSNIQIIGNEVIDNSFYGISLLNCRSCTVTENNVSNNGQGLWLATYSAQNRIYHNNFINNRRQTNVSPRPVGLNFWDNGYPSGGNYWSDYNGTDLFSGPYQNETGIDGIGDKAYIIYEKNHDYYPLMNPWSPTDISITSMVLSATEVYAGQAINITVNVLNNGTIPETFTVTCKYELEGAEYFVGSVSVVGLSASAAKTVIFNLTTTMIGKHTIEVEATTLPDETNPADNKMTSLVIVKMLGDVNGDNIVDIEDITIAALAFGSHMDYLRWNPQADINQDSKIDIRDLVLIAKNFGKTYP